VPAVLDESGGEECEAMTTLIDGAIDAMTAVVDAVAELALAEQAVIEDTPVVRLLREARALIEQGWCQGHAAETARGSHVDSFNSRAVRFCISGALTQASRRTRASFAMVQAAADELCTAGDINSLVQWNDANGRTQQQVLDLFGYAILGAEAAALVARWGHDDAGA
jgi:hypothetical protein